MQYTVNTKQRVYVGENKFSIMLYKKMIIDVNKSSHTITIMMGDDVVFHKKFSESFFKLIKKDIERLLSTVHCEPLLEEYSKDVQRIIRNNSKYILTIFKQLL